MVTCTSCNGANNDDATVCLYCGERLQKRSLPRRILDGFAGMPAEGATDRKLAMRSKWRGGWVDEHRKNALKSQQATQEMEGQPPDEAK